MSVWIPPCKHLSVCLSVSTCLCMHLCVCVHVYNMYICIFFLVHWLDWQSHMFCFAWSCIYSQALLENNNYFFISVLFIFWLLFSLKWGPPFILIFLPSVLWAIWVINYSELGYWKCWIWDRQRHCYCHGSQVKSPMTGKMEASHLFLKRVKRKMMETQTTWLHLCTQ